MGVGEAYDRPYLSRELDLIEQARQDDDPILSVCLGSQLLAHVLRAEVQPGSQKEVGSDEVQLTNAAANDPLFRDVYGSFTAFPGTATCSPCPTEPCAPPGRRGRSIRHSDTAIPPMDFSFAWR